MYNNYSKNLIWAQTETTTTTINHHHHNQADSNHRYKQGKNHRNHQADNYRNNRHHRHHNHNQWKTPLPPPSSTRQPPPRSQQGSMDASARSPSTRKRIEFPQLPSTDFHSTARSSNEPMAGPSPGRTQCFDILSDLEHDASKMVTDAEKDCFYFPHPGTSIPANPPQEPSSACPPGFFTQPTQQQPQQQQEEERGRQRKPRAERNTTNCPCMGTHQPPVPPPDTPQKPQPSPDTPMHIPPPSQTRPSHETKVKKKMY